MFSDEILEAILVREEIRTIPLDQLSVMLHVIYEVLKEKRMLKEN